MPGRNRSRAASRDSLRASPLGTPWDHPSTNRLYYPIPPTRIPAFNLHSHHPRRSALCRESEAFIGTNSDASSRRRSAGSLLHTGGRGGGNVGYPGLCPEGRGSGGVSGDLDGDRLVGSGSPRGQPCGSHGTAGSLHRRLLRAFGQAVCGPTGGCCASLHIQLILCLTGGQQHCSQIFASAGQPFVRGWGGGSWQRG